MASDDWYRNRKWNKKIVKLFEDKLSRARHKAQYLRIQASMLTESEPQVALDLLDRYFALNDHFDHAPAFVDQATALLGLGRIDEAVEAYERALLREEEFPNVTTQAYIDLPYLIATHSIPTKFDRAIEILDGSADRPVFLIEIYKWHACLALIYASRSIDDIACQHARIALEAARKDSSGFPYHRDLGLVGTEFRQVMRKLKQIAQQ